MPNQTEQQDTREMPDEPKRWQKKTAAVEWLSTSIVHDLRNPLGANCEAAEMLIVADAAPAQVNRLATNIYRAAGRVIRLPLNRARTSRKPLTGVLYAR